MKYKDGSATVLVSYFPQVDVDGETYLDEEGNGPGDLLDSEDEEGEGGSIDFENQGGNDSETTEEEDEEDE
jgi:hypothetical protein